MSEAGEGSRGTGEKYDYAPCSRTLRNRSGAVGGHLHLAAAHGLSRCTRLLMSHTLPLMYRYIYPLPDSKSGAVCHCSEQCQASDWAARHKATCSEAAENRKQMEIVGEMLQKFSDPGLSGDLPAWSSFG